MLAQQGVTMADLKNDTARQILIGRLKQIVAEGVVVTPAEIEADFHQKNDKTRIQYAVLSSAKYQKEAEPTDAELKAYYDAHKASFQTPEKRSLGIILIDPNKVKVTMPTDAQLRKDYNANLDQFRTPERVNARHILIKSDKTNDAAMKAKAEGILKQIQAGGDFAKLAKENSQDNAPGGSAEKGGELGWLVKGQTVPEFEKAAFSLQPGQTSGLVKTEYGYHIIQVEQHEQAHLQSFEEVKPALMRTFMERESSDELQKMADKAAAELRKDPMHPDKAAEAVGLTAIHADNIQAGDPLPDVGNAKEVTDAIAPLHKGEMAGPIVLPGNRIVVVSVTDYQPARQATLDEAKADVRNRASAGEASEASCREGQPVDGESAVFGRGPGESGQRNGHRSEDFDGRGSPGRIRGRGLGGNRSGRFHQAGRRFVRPCGGGEFPATGGQSDRADPCQPGGSRKTNGIDPRRVEAEESERPLDALRRRIEEAPDRRGQAQDQSGCAQPAASELYESQLTESQLNDILCQKPLR